MVVAWVVSKAVVIAAAVRGDGRRQIIGVDIGDAENETCLTLFLRELTDHGLTGIQVVITDVHRGPTAPISRVGQVSGWQRCRVHTLRQSLHQQT